MNWLMLSQYELVPAYHCLQWRRRENDKGTITLILSILSFSNVTAGDNRSSPFTFFSHPLKTAYELCLHLPKKAHHLCSRISRSQFVCYDPQELMKKALYISVAKGIFLLLSLECMKQCHGFYGICLLPRDQLGLCGYHPVSLSSGS